MKGIGVILLLFLLLIPIASSLGEKAQGTIIGKEKGTLGILTTPEQQRTLSQQLETQIQSSISTGTTVNLNTPEYRDNPEVVKGVLKEKFNMDINSFTGVTIEAGILKFGNSEIDLQAGKQIKLEIQGNTITKYEDGETIILNAEGVKIDSNSKEVKRAEAVKDGETDIQFLQTYKDDGQTTTIAQATLISSDNSIINNAKSITLKRSNNKLLHADFVCNADNNQATLNEVQIVCNQNNKVNAEITLSTVDLTLDKGSTFQYQNIQGTADENGATVKITKLAKETRVETKFTTTKFENQNIQETLIAKTVSIAHIDNNEGFYELELGPTSRFSSRNKQDESKSFFYLNTGDETNKVFITKPTHRLIPELIKNYQFFARQDEFIMLGKGDWGVYQDALPTAIIESLEQNNKLKIDQTTLDLTYTCNTNGKLATLHNDDFNIIDVCKNNDIQRFAWFEADNPERFEAIKTKNKPTITISQHTLLQVDNNGKVFKMASKKGKEQAERNIQTYTRSFQHCSAWEDHLDEKTTLLDWLRT